MAGCNLNTMAAKTISTILRSAYIDLTSSFSFLQRNDSFMNMSSSNWDKALSGLLLTPAIWTSQLNIVYCRQYRLCLRIKDPRRVVNLLILQYRAQLPHLFFDLTFQISTTTKKRNNCKKLMFIVVLCPVQATDSFVMEQWRPLKQITHCYCMK